MLGTSRTRCVPITVTLAVDTSTTIDTAAAATTTTCAWLQMHEQERSTAAGSLLRRTQNYRPPRLPRVHREGAGGGVFPEDATLGRTLIFTKKGIVDKKCRRPRPQPPLPGSAGVRLLLGARTVRQHGSHSCLCATGSGTTCSQSGWSSCAAKMVQVEYTPPSCTTTARGRRSR